MPVRSKSKPPSEAEIISHREKWLKTVAAFSDKGRAEVYRKSEGAYTWLKAHDKMWLDANLPPCKTPSHPSITWPQSTSRRGHQLTQKDQEERDRGLAETVRERARAFMNAPGLPQWVTLRKLRQEISTIPAPALRRKFYPLTEQALKEVVESAEHFASRRVYWVAQQYLAEQKSLTRWKLIQKARVKWTQNKPLVQAAIQEAMSRLTLLD